MDSLPDNEPLVAEEVFGPPLPPVQPGLTEVEGPPPERRSAWWETLAVWLLLGAIGAATAVYCLDPELGHVREAADQICADTFVNGICLGIHVGEDAEENGYSQAYAELSDEAKAEWPPSRFVDFFDDIVAREGLMLYGQGIDDEARGSFAEKQLVYRVSHDGGVERYGRLELKLLRDVDVYRIASFVYRGPDERR